MLKNIVKTALQKILGYNRYLFVFSVFTINRIQKGNHQSDFLYFVSMIPNRGAILDIGANIGIVTTILAKRLNRAFVYAFEPIPDNLATLKRVTDHYALKNVKVIETALGETKGELTMVVPKVGKAYMQGLSHVVEAGTNPHGHFVVVPVQALDAVAELQEVPEIVAIKIDVENFEYYVLKGGREMIKKHRPLIFCELWNDERREFCFEYFNELGYTRWVYEKGGLVDFAGQDTLNFFFLP